MLQGVEGGDATLGVVVQHAEDQIWESKNARSDGDAAYTQTRFFLGWLQAGSRQTFELQVVAGGVSGLSGPPSSWTSGLYAQDLVKAACGWGLILLQDKQCFSSEGGAFPPSLKSSSPFSTN